MHRPPSVEQLQQLVARSERVRALGTGHSFSRIADCPGDLISVAGLPRIMDIDADHATVTISAGIQYGELAAHLHRTGYALHNLGSLPHISVAGACATGTHGSGDRNRGLASAVSAMELVTAGGDIVTMSRKTEGDQFCGAVVGLGALGIVTRMTLDIVPAFDVRQLVYEDLPREHLDASFDVIFSSAYSVSLFTDWRGPSIKQVWLKQRGCEYDSRPPLRRWLGARLADGPRNPLPGMEAAYCTDQMGVPGPWHLRLPHFRQEFTPSSGEELQSEYLVARGFAAEALAAINRIRDRVAPILQISEIRTVAADDLWLSPSYQRDSASIHFTWIKDAQAVTPVLAAIEDVLAPLAARPHWGKLFCVSPRALWGLYERLPDFERLVCRYDPAGVFRNEFVSHVLEAE